MEINSQWEIYPDGGRNASEFFFGIKAPEGSNQSMAVLSDIRECQGSSEVPYMFFIYI